MERTSYRASVIKYIVGFVGSLVTTGAAYLIVVEHSVAGVWLLLILGILAITQMTLQLVFFLHLGEDVWSRVRLASLGFMLLILLILVIGSLWIMENLNYNMMHMSPQEKTDYMTVQRDKGF